MTYIKTTKEKLWEAITKPEFTKLYFYGTEFRTDLMPGSKFGYYMNDENGKEIQPVYGKIIEVVPYEKLIHTFDKPDSDDKPTRVTYEIEEVDKMIKLTLVHDNFEHKSETYNSVQQGWPFILSGLKTYLETGETLK